MAGVEGRVLGDLTVSEADDVPVDGIDARHQSADRRRAVVGDRLRPKDEHPTAVTAKPAETGGILIGHCVAVSCKVGVGVTPIVAGGHRSGGALHGKQFPGRPERRRNGGQRVGQRSEGTTGIDDGRSREQTQLALRRRHHEVRAGRREIDAAARRRHVQDRRYCFGR